MASGLQTRDAGAVRHLVLDRPERRNALGAVLIEALLEAFAAAAADPSVGAIVLRGDGAGFSAGADLKETAALAGETEIRAHADRLRRLLMAPPASPKPVVAAVHGFALGAGCALALACDAAFCTPGTVFGYPEARHGIVPALVVPGLVRRVGRTAAFDLLSSGRTLAAEEAAGLGLVRLVEDAGAAAQAHAEALAGQPAGVVAALKALIADTDGLPLAEALARAAETNVASRLGRAGTDKDRTG